MGTFMLPFKTACSNIQLSPSIAIVKRYGESGSPCRMPFVLPKKPIGEPLKILGIMPNYVPTGSFDISG